MEKELIGQIITCLHRLGNCLTVLPDLSHDSKQAFFDDLDKLYEICLKFYKDKE